MSQVTEVSRIRSIFEAQMHVFYGKRIRREYINALCEYFPPFDECMDTLHGIGSCACHNEKDVAEHFEYHMTRTVWTSLYVQNVEVDLQYKDCVAGRCVCVANTCRIISNHVTDPHTDPFVKTLATMLCEELREKYGLFECGDVKLERERVLFAELTAYADACKTFVDKFCTLDEGIARLIHVARTCETLALIIELHIHLCAIIHEADCANLEKVCTDPMCDDDTIRSRINAILENFATPNTICDHVESVIRSKFVKVVGKTPRQYPQFDYPDGCPKYVWVDV